MNERPREADEKPHDWMLAQLLHHPLLAAEEEQAIDQDKWRAVEALQTLMLDDKAGRNYLARWAHNLLDNPPDLKAFKPREYYNLLKREQQDIQRKGKARTALVQLRKRLEGPPDSAGDWSALARLPLSGVLVTGLAEDLLDEPQTREMAAAIRQWRKFWIRSQADTRRKLQAGTRRDILAGLKTYYTARSTLVQHNLRLVYAIAGRINGRGLPYEDLVQGGMPGLIRAAEKYRHQRGYRFSTYAYNWINQSIRQLVENTHGIVRYPAGVNEQVSRLYRERLHHINATGSEPGVSYLAQRMQMAPEDLLQLKQVGNLSVSLENGFAGNDEGLPLGEILPADTFEATTRGAEIRSLNRCLLRKLAVLQPVERRVIILRWGLERLPPLSRSEVAEHMQVSTEWVRQLEVSALDRLRQDKELVETYQDYLV